MEQKRDSVETFQKRLRDEVAAVDNEINTCNQQLEALNKRLEGLKRARELFDSEPAAVTELLRTSTHAENGAEYRGTGFSGGSKGVGVEIPAAQRFPEIRRGSRSRDAAPVLKCPRADSRSGASRPSARRQP
jgi:hypothetical protein